MQMTGLVRNLCIVVLLVECRPAVGSLVAQETVVGTSVETAVVVVDTLAVVAGEVVVVMNRPSAVVVAGQASFALLMIAILGMKPAVSQIVVAEARLGSSFVVVAVAWLESSSVVVAALP